MVAGYTSAISTQSVYAIALRVKNYAIARLEVWGPKPINFSEQKLNWASKCCAHNEESKYKNVLTC